MNGFHQLSLSLYFKEYDNEREHVEKEIVARVWVRRDLLRDNKEWEWVGKEEKIDEGTIRNSEC